MQISDDKLIGWLCILRNQFDGDTTETLLVPDTVSAELAKRGWIDMDGDLNWQGTHDTLFTDEGRRVSDLNAAEWGIDPL